LATLALAAVMVLAWVFGRSSFDAAVEWLRGRGKVWGLVILALAYTPAALLLFPATLLTLGAGAVFGVPEATIAISLGSTFAAGVVFLVGRTLARHWVEGKFANSPRFRALDRAVADNGFRIVLLTRLSPAFPYTVLNYAYGLTKVRFRDYLLASWIGMLPGTLMYVYLGRGAKGIADLASVLFRGQASATDVEQGVLLLVGLLATVAVTVLVTRLARTSLRKALDEQPARESHP
jgi:uncharacterized membrane protein YdjX (TVP38/TMEM64 family)